jgi:exopolysaccharide production protein ExoQ
VAIKLFNLPLRKFLANAEIGFVLFYLLFSESVNIVSQLSTLINVLSYVFVGIMALRLWKRIAYVITLDLSLITLVGFAAFSVLWSADSDYSLRMAFGMLRTTLFGIYLATRFPFEELFKIFAWASGLIVSVNLFMFIAFPSFSIVGDAYQSGQLVFLGIYAHKQMVGRVMALSVITLLMYFKIHTQHRWLTALGVLGALGTLLLSRSSTYLIAVVIAISLFPLYKIMNQGFKLRTVMLVLALAVMAVFSSFMIANWEVIVSSLLGKGTTFNGRTPIWTLAIEQFMKRSIFGYGYAGFWRSDEGWQVFASVPWALGENPLGIDGATTFTAHNAFLDLALQLGLIGLATLVLNIILMIYRAITLMIKIHSLEGFWMLQVLSIQLVGSCFEPPIYLASNNIHWIIYVATAYSSANLLRRLRQNRPNYSTFQLNSSP